MILTELLSLLLTGAACFCVVFAVVRIIFESAALQDKKVDATRYNDSNTREIRKKETIFRFAESFIRELSARFFEKSALATEFEHYLFIKGDDPPWTAPLFLATTLVKGAVAGVGAFVAVSLYARNPLLGIVAGLVFCALIFYLTTNSYRGDAKKIKEQIKRRLPFVVDLMSLVLRAGASFHESLRAAAEENGDSPVARVFQRVYNDIDTGTEERDALTALAERMRDDDFDEIALTINRGQESGSSYEELLTALAAQMRLRRQQQGEKLAGEASVRMLIPGVIVMIACMLIIVAPFALMWYNGGSIFGEMASK